MKIYRIRLQNINSLKSHHEIDFTGPLGEQGLFAITGPTGSGKTTLLDVICAALYARTPRLTNINDLMSRHTGECLAEVEFSTPKGQFRSMWSQRRARKSPDGAFQSPHMELAGLEDNVIIATGTSKVPKKIEEITGLDFNQFTRSMLLAQGGFDAFLKSKDTERAELLEKMTGTEIYARISKQIFDREKKERTKLEHIIGDLDTLEILSPEEVENLKDVISELENNQTALGNKLKSLQEDINRHKKISTLRGRIEEAKQLVAETVLETENNKPKLELLEKAERAARLKGLFDSHNEISREVTSLKKDKKNLEEQEKETGLTISAKQKDLKDFTADLEEFSRHFESEIAKIDKTLLLDQKIEKELLIQNELETEIDVITKKISTLSDEIETSLEDKEDIEGKIRRLGRYLEYHKEDKNIDKDLPVLEKEIRRMMEFEKERQDILKEMEKNRKRLKKQHEKLHQLQDERKEAKKHLKEEQKEHSQVEMVFLSLMGNESYEELEERQEVYQELELILKNLEFISRDYHQQLKDKNEYSRTLSENLEEQGKLDIVITDKQKELDHNLEIQAQLEEKLKLEQLIINYHDDRKKLQKGEPCPLCGSLEHPWESTSPEQNLSKTENLLDKQKKQIEILRADLGNDKEKRSSLESTMTNMDMNISRITINLESLKKEWNHHSHTVNEKEMNIDNPVELENIIKQHHEDESRISRLLHELREHKNNLYTLKDSMHQKQEILQNIELQLEHKKSQISHLDREYEGFEKDTAQLDTKTNNIIEEIKTICESYSLSYSKGDENYVLEELKNRGEGYFSVEGTLLSNKEFLSSLENALIQLETEQKGLKDNRVSLKDKIKGVKDIKQTLQQQRFSLLGDVQCREYKAELTKKKQTLEDSLAGIDGNLRELEKEYSKTTSRLADTTMNLKKKEKIHTDRLNELITQTGNLGFTTLEDFARSLLDDNQANELRRYKEDLHKRTIQAETELASLEKELRKEDTSQYDESALAIFEKKHGDIEISYNETVKSIGEKQHEYSHQLSQEKKMGTLYKKKALQEKEYRKWSMLNELVGSADGKKFRKYAQGLTLDYLIDLANSHLGKLTDRYVLRRSEGGKSYEQLGLEIIDTYQADVVRPTNTLSGGETFLVSLSLALGLSDLVSRNTSLESLFLDEGFGTLDENTLETALSALDALKNSGKVIGVISHVEALKERITTQIQIRQLSGGVSTLQVVI